MKNGNQNFSGIPKNRKAFLIFFYYDNVIFSSFFVALQGISVSVSACRRSEKWTLMPLIKMLPHIYECEEGKEIRTLIELHFATKKLEKKNA